MKTLFQKCFGGMASILRAQIQIRALGANMVMAGLSHCQFHLSYSNLQSHKVSGFCQAPCVQISLSLFRMRHSLACDHYPMQVGVLILLQDLVGSQQFLKAFLYGLCWNILCLSLTIHGLICSMFFSFHICFLSQMLFPRHVLWFQSTL